MDPQLDPLAALGALAGSLLFATVKKFTGALDGKIGDVVKPLQPALIMGAGFALPLVSQALGLAGPVDPLSFVTSPLTTVALVSTRELYTRAKRRLVPVVTG